MVRGMGGKGNTREKEKKCIAVVLPFHSLVKNASFLCCIIHYITVCFK